MLQLSDRQINHKKDFIHNYFLAQNAADGSKMDANANVGQKYLRQIEAHEIYVHDETSLKPYCTSISMYPFLLDGLTKLGGESKAPQHLESFCGSFVNLIFAISAQFAGAVATVEFITYFDYFARLEYGDNYLTSHKKAIENHLQHVVYGIFPCLINITLPLCLKTLFFLTFPNQTGKPLNNCSSFFLAG